MWLLQRHQMQSDRMDEILTSKRVVLLRSKAASSNWGPEKPLPGGLVSLFSHSGSSDVSQAFRFGLKKDGEVAFKQGNELFRRLRAGIRRWIITSDGAADENILW